MQSFSGHGKIMAPRKRLWLLILLIVTIAACGPEPIFLRPALDTPEQHVKNGHNLLARGKLDAARAEFSRAQALDADYAPAYVGIALVQAQKGDVDGGLVTLERARSLASTVEQEQEVERCFERLKGM